MAKTAEGKRRDLLVVESRPAIIEQHVDQMGLNQDTAEEVVCPAFRWFVL